MSAPFNLLSKYYTNAYILHDFAEIAYIVCTLANLGGAEPSREGKSLDATLVRLRNAERQFRQASILVALDEDKLELFTFYKKVDVLKDQKAILNRFSQVCRLNSCNIARKSAARILDLLKPESNRVYQLFTTAILSSVQLGAYGSGDVIHISPTIALVTEPDEGNESSFEPSATRLWQLKRVCLQLLASGQLLLTIQQAKSGPLVQLHDLIIDQMQGFGALISDCILYLTPTGQLARYKNGWYGRTSELSHDWNEFDAQTNHYSSIRYQWIEAALEWFSDKPDYATKSNTDLIWIEIEIPLIEITKDKNGVASRSLVWKSILWPAQFIHVFQRTLTPTPEEGAVGEDFDPIGFVHDWLNATAERNSSIAATNIKEMHRSSSIAEKTFNEDMAFEDQELAHAFGPPTSTAGQMIYPTPPDGPNTHPTPGVSSVDGLAPTPFPVSQQAFTAPETSPDLDMHHSADVETDLQGGLDPSEDLFGELRDDDFDDNENGDEPNWDFFDQPGFVGHASHKLDLEGNGTEQDPDVDSLVGISAHNSHHVNSADADFEGKRQLETLQTSDLGQDTSAGEMVVKRNSHEQHHHSTDPGLSLTIDVQPGDSIKMDLLEDAANKDYQKAKPRTPEDNTNVGSFEDAEQWDAQQTANKTSTLINPDTKYKSEGKYWFQPFTGEGAKPQNLYSQSAHARPVSSESDTSMSSWESGVSIEDINLDRGNESVGKTWVDYQLPVDDENKFDFGPTGEDLLSPDVSSLLDIIATSSGDEPFRLDVARPSQLQSGSTYKGKLATMVAHMLVEQVTQSSFFKDTSPLYLQQHTILSAVEVSMDHNEARTNITSSTLGDLTTLQSTSQAVSPHIKMNGIRKPQVVIGRGEDQIVADPTILEFWDVLGLQPIHGHKNLHAFCLSPSQPKISNHCKIFLSRISETYTAGNFGTHQVGTVIGHTNNGVLEWQGDFHALDALSRLAQSLGSALASTADIKGTIVIYVVCPESNLTIYKDICHAFVLLFEAFAKASTNTQQAKELVLQLIPISFVASPHTLVIPAQQRYIDLAIEVYNRIPGVSDEKSPGSCEMAVVLESPRPKNIDFELTVDSVNPLSKDGAYLHLAYAYSLDGRWLVAAWTDASGKIALTMPYQLRSQGNDHRLRREIFREIWEVSNDIMNQETSQWRLAIARSGYFDLDELNEWLQLINQANQDRKSLARITLMSVQLDSTIMLDQNESPSRPSPISAVGGANATGTPVTTPQNHTTSPDHGMIATPTPGGVSLNNALSPSDQHLETPIENDAVLVDPREDSWSVTLGFGLNQASDSISIRPAGASAMLFKAAQSQDDGRRLLSIEVSLLVTSRSMPANPSQSEREGILHGMLEQFRGLITLAETRGSINQDRECVPWHIATAVKGASILSYTL